jgi:hypothetical protein
MSTTTLDQVHVSDEHRPEAMPRRSLLQRFIAARIRKAELIIGQQLNWLPDEKLTDLGLTSQEIAVLRATGRLVRCPGEAA